MHIISPSRTFWQIAVEALGAWRRRDADLADLRRCDPVEVNHIADDLGLSRATLFTLAAKRPDSADLLLQRMQVLGLDPKVVGAEQTADMRDLQRCCSCCDNKPECGHDLDNHPQDSRWRNYCPNSHTLAALQEGK